MFWNRTRHGPCCGTAMQVRPSIRLLTIAVAVLPLAGYGSGGYTREVTPTDACSHYVVSLCASASRTGATTAAPVDLPLAVGVAEVGELAPPSAVLQTLRAKPELIRRAEAVPALVEHTALYR